MISLFDHSFFILFHGICLPEFYDWELGVSLEEGGYFSERRCFLGYEIMGLVDTWRIWLDIEFVF